MLMSKRIFLCIIGFLVLCLSLPVATGFASDDPSFSIAVASSGQNYKVGDILTFTISGCGIQDMYAFETVIIFDLSVPGALSQGRT